MRGRFHPIKDTLYHIAYSQLATTPFLVVLTRVSVRNCLSPRGALGGGVGIVPLVGLSLGCPQMACLSSGVVVDPRMTYMSCHVKA